MRHSAPHPEIQLSRLFFLVLGYLSILFVLDAGKDVLAVLEGRGPVGPLGFLTDAVTWWVAWIPLLIPGLRIAQRFSPDRVGWFRSVLVNLGVTGLLVLAHVLIVSALFHLMPEAPEGVTVLQRAGLLGRAHLMSEALTNWGAVALLYAFGLGARLREHELEAARLRAAMSEARLETLKREIRPHFLFNALNSVGGLVRSNRPGAATEMLDALASLLRSSLEWGERSTIPLEEELLLLDQYIRVEAARWGDALKVVMEMDEGLEAAAVPPLVLQPIVENAIHHGLEEGGTVLVRATRQDDTLFLDVSDPGKSEGTPERSGIGLGLSNTRERIKGLFGSAGSLELIPEPKGGTRVRIVLPLREVEPTGALLSGLTGGTVDA